MLTQGPFLKKKKIRCYLTHGAPALPVKTMYLNSVKLRLVLGVFTFVFGWGETGVILNNFGQYHLSLIKREVSI